MLSRGLDLDRLLVALLSSSDLKLLLLSALNLLPGEDVGSALVVLSRGLGLDGDLIELLSSSDLHWLLTSGWEFDLERDLGLFPGSLSCLLLLDRRLDLERDLVEVLSSCELDLGLLSSCDLE